MAIYLPGRGDSSAQIRPNNNDNKTSTNTARWRPACSFEYRANKERYRRWPLSPNREPCFCDVGTPDGRSEAYTNAPDVALHRAEFMQRACRRRKSDLVPLTRQSLDGTQGEKLLVEFLDNVCIYSASPVGYE